MGFSGKVVLITGAAGGIGSATVKAFAAKGAMVALVDLHQEALEKTARDLNLEKGKYLLLAANVADEEQVQGYVQKTRDTFGRIDVFFNNAGISGTVAPVADYPSDVFNAVIDVNLKGVFYGLKHVLRVMREQKSGSIINTASIAGQRGMPMTSAYVAAKWGVVGLTKSAAVEMAKEGVRVNAVCPSPVDTPLMRTLETGMSPENRLVAKEQLEAGVPMGRYGEPEEIAQAVVFLASAKASFITGMALAVDGGFLA